MLNPRNLVIALLVTLSAAPAFVVPAFAQLQQYQTTLNLQTPVVNTQGVDQVIWRWSTEIPSGKITELDLQDMVLVLVADGTTLYQDNVILGGVVQPFQGQDRLPEIDYFWDYDLDTLFLNQMVNVGWDKLVSSTGEVYGVNDSISISDDNIVDVLRFVDGETADGASDQLDFQTTEPILFYDGFERGDLTAWSSSSP